MTSTQPKQPCRIVASATEKIELKRASFPSLKTETESEIMVEQSASELKGAYRKRKFISHSPVQNFARNASNLTKETWDSLVTTYASVPREK